MVMTLKELEKVHDHYDMYCDVWKRCYAAYAGADELLSYGALVKHCRESESNYNRRKAESYAFSFSRGIVDLYNQYLFQKEVQKELPASLSDDPLYKMFLDDCDLEGSNFTSFLNASERFVSIFGFIGIMVDKPTVGPVSSKKVEIDNKIYPYLSTYLPEYILDWEYQRNLITGRPELVYLKLIEENGHYKIWRPNIWEEYRIVNEGNSRIVEFVAGGDRKSVV